MIVDVIVEKLVDGVWYYRHMSKLKKGDSFRMWYLKEDKWERYVNDKDGSTQWTAISNSYIDKELDVWTIDIVTVSIIDRYGKPA